MRKLHDNIAVAAIESLKNVLQENKRTSRVLQKMIATHPKWGARDRKMLYTIVFDCLRWRRLFAHYIQTPTESTTPEQLLTVWCHKNDSLWADALPMRLIDDPQEQSPVVQASYPDWLFELGQKELPSYWEKEYPALNQQAGVSLRTNRLRTHPKKLQEELASRYQIESQIVPDTPDALQLTQRRKLDRNALFLKGYFEIQDAHSQKVAPFTQLIPGMNVIDLCAGAGGKSLQLAALMRNKGNLRAYDIEANKLKELQRRARRAGAKIIRTEVLEQGATLPENENWADVVLIDAPCSGLGTLKRNPELKWRLTEATLKNLQQTQTALLEQAAPWVKPNGVLVYATCSILPSENQQIVSTFLKNHKCFHLEEEQGFYAHQSAFDGFYMARMKKTS